MRLIDADELLSELKPITYEMKQNAVTIADMSNIMRNWVRRQPTVLAYGQWVSVKDRLPEQFQRVLICRRRRYGQLYWDNVVIDLGHEVIQNRHGDITHWMPLPEPPKKGHHEY